MSNSKTITMTTGQALSLTTGMMLCENFGLVQEAAEKVLGQPIWTHQFASQQVTDDLKNLVLAGGPPWLVHASESAPKFSDMDRSEAEGAIREWLATLTSPTVEIEVPTEVFPVGFATGLENLGRGRR